MEKIIGIDAKNEKENIVLTITTKENEMIDFPKFTINEKDLEYVNLCNIPRDILTRIKMKIDDIFEREIKIQEILKNEFPKNK